MRDAETGVDIERLEAANTALRAELDAARTQPAPLEELERKRENLISDVGKFRKLIEYGTLSSDARYHSSDLPCLSRPCLLCPSFKGCGILTMGPLIRSPFGYFDSLRCCCLLSHLPLAATNTGCVGVPYRNLRAHGDMLRKKVDEKTADLAAKRTELAAVAAENQELTARVAAQVTQRTPQPREAYLISNLPSIEKRCPVCRNASLCVEAGRVSAGLATVC